MSKKELPTFKTAEEFDEFFETHDLGEYWDEFEDVTDIEFVRPRPAHVVIPVEVSEPLLEVLEAQAAKSNVPLPVLVRRWLAEYAREHLAVPAA